MENVPVASLARIIPISIFDVDSAARIEMINFWKPWCGFQIHLGRFHYVKTYGCSEWSQSVRSFLHGSGCDLQQIMVNWYHNRHSIDFIFTCVQLYLWIFIAESATGGQFSGAVYSNMCMFSRLSCNG